MKNLFKKGSKVKVCVGKDKGKTGEIIEINRFRNLAKVKGANMQKKHKKATCLLYTSPSPRDRQKSRMPSSA